MKNIKKYGNRRLIYSLSAGVLAVALAAGGAMLISGGKDSSESPYLSMNETPAQVVISETEEAGATVPAETESSAARVPRETVPAAVPSTAAAAGTAETESSEAPETVNAKLKTADDLGFSADSRLSWPTEGEILRDFSMDATVYYPTLNAYKVSPAVLIQSEAGTPVKAPAEGIIRQMGYNQEIGNYVILELGNGYELTLGQLADLQAAAGDYVEAGTVLAEVAEPTIYYSIEGDNLYFQMTKDGEAIDPLDFMD